MTTSVITLKAYRERKFTTAQGGGGFQAAGGPASSSPPLSVRHSRVPYVTPAPRSSFQRKRESREVSTARLERAEQPGRPAQRSGAGRRPKRPSIATDVGGGLADACVQLNRDGRTTLYTQADARSSSDVKVTIRPVPKRLV